MKFANGNITRRVEPDEIVVGMLLTVLRGRKYHIPGGMFDAFGGVTTVHECEDRGGKGSLLRVTGVCLPYVNCVDLSDTLCLSDSWLDRDFDIRETEFGLVSREFARRKVKQSRSKISDRKSFRESLAPRNRSHP